MSIIREENALPGARTWLLDEARVDPDAPLRCTWIEGYVSASSVAAGEQISFHVSTAAPSPFRIELYRMGYYGGDGGRRVATLGPFEGRRLEVPPATPTGRRDCEWPPCATLTVPAEWTSGVYLGKLISERHQAQSYLVFVVRDHRPCDLLLQCSDATWCAYNRWPARGSLYDNGEEEWSYAPGIEASFDRPFGKYCQIVDAPLSTGSGEWFLWEFPVAYWLEGQGYDVSYVSNLDLHARPETLARARAYLSVGHDEYYSLPMYHNLREGIERGLSVAFLSSNVCCGLVDFLPAADGRSHRAIRRLDRFGPRDARGDEVFPSMRDLERSSPNEAELIGARSTGPILGAAPWTCRDPGHWLFAGTAMRQGEEIPGLVGWEWHGQPAGIPGLEVVAAGETTSIAGSGSYAATLYPGPRGNLVFNASTCWWGDGLSSPPGYVRPAAFGLAPQGPDPRVQRITANLLERMLDSGSCGGIAEQGLSGQK